MKRTAKVSVIMIVILNLQLLNSCKQRPETPQELNKQQAIKLISVYLKRHIKQYVSLAFSNLDSAFNSDRQFVAYRITHSYKVSQKDAISEFHINTHLTKVLNYEALDTSNVYLEDGQVKTRRIY